MTYSEHLARFGLTTCTRCKKPHSDKSPLVCSGMPVLRKALCVFCLFELFGIEEKPIL